MNPAPALPTLLETKLCPAIGAAEPIVRAQLQLPEAFRDGRISLATVIAPAGYGKSTVMAQWQHALEDAGVRTTWLNLDEDDSDPARFARYLGGALRRGGLDAGTALRDAQDTLLSGGIRAVLEALATELSELSHRLVLFIDDVHFVRGDEVLEVLRWLVNYAPAQVQFVLGSREDVPVPLGRLRVRRKLQEFGVEALKFSDEETAALLSSRLRAQLAPADIHSLVQRTEGWPAGLELAALILDGAQDPSAVVRAFAGNAQSVMDYLGEVLLDNLDQPTRELIFVIAQFNRIDEGLAAAACDAPLAGARLAELHARNLFLKRMDAQGRWYRFHHLVGQFFREQGERQCPELARDALIRGARHLMAQNLPLEAIHCVMRAQAWDLASRWLAENVEELVFSRGYLQTIMEWMKRLPREWADRYPEIHLQNAFATMLNGQPDQSRLILDNLAALRQRLAASAELPRSRLDQLDQELAMQEAHVAGLGDQMHDMMRISSDWVQRWPQAPRVNQGSVRNVLAFAHKCYSQIDQGLAVIAEGKRLFQGTDAHYLMSWNLAIESYLHLKGGDFSAAASAAEQLLEHMRRHLSLMHQHAGHAHAVLAFVHYERDEIAAAREHIDCISENDSYAQADYLILHHITRARLLRLDGDAEAGYQSLLKGREIADRFQLSRAALTLATEQFNWLCRDGHLDQAHELARRLQLDHWPEQDKAVSLDAEKSLRVCARLQLMRDPLDAAERLIPAITRCRDLGLVHREAELLVLQVLALSAADKPVQAQHRLAEALLLGAERGYVRLFMDEGEVLQRVLNRVELMPDQQAAAHLLRRLTQCAVATPLKPVAAASVNGLVEELTKRERQILRRLQSDLSNREIAEAIFVSEGTLKWHLHNIYGKLGVKNRSGALVRALELGLI